MIHVNYEEIYEAAFNPGSVSPIKAQLKEALEVIDSALDSFNQEQLSISFNGGKDCTVLLHLYAAALAKRSIRTRIRAVYIPLPSPYEELEAFIQESVHNYDLDLFHCLTTPSAQLPVEIVQTSDSATGDLQPKKYKGGEGMKRALEVYKERFPEVQAVLIGMRRADPHGEKLGFRNKTDPGWPDFTRINPIINWSYTDVWDFLRTFSVPYCKLYDEGYTSLGSTYNTSPNPALKNGDIFSAKYLPAYELLDGSLERAGRLMSSNVQTS